jgi:hypothetical protein
MEKASGGSFARTTRKTAEDEGRRRGGLGHDAIHIQTPGLYFFGRLGHRQSPRIPRLRHLESPNVRTIL